MQTILEGLSIQARDGATLETTNATIDCAMAGWDRLAAPPESLPAPRPETSAQG